MLYTAQNGKKTLQMTKLQCDFGHPGHLDKVDQSDYWKITTHSKIESKVKKKTSLISCVVKCCLSSGELTFVRNDHNRPCHGFRHHLDE